MQLQPADIFLSRGTGLASGVIRFFTRRIGERLSKASHTGVVVAGGSLERARVVEALVRVGEHPLSRYDKKAGTQVAIYRPLRLDAAQRAAVVAKTREYVGREYGYFQLVGHFLDWFLQGAYVFRRLTGSDDYPICSWVVAHAFAVVGVTFGVEPGAAQPDDIHDYVSTHPDQFERIREFAPL